MNIVENMAYTRYRILCVKNYRNHHLGGTLMISLLDILDPATIQYDYFFDILLANTITDNFNVFNLPVVAEFSIFSLSYWGSCLEDIVRVQFNAVPIPCALLLLASGLIGNDEIVLLRQFINWQNTLFRIRRWTFDVRRS